MHSFGLHGNKIKLPSLPKPGGLMGFHTEIGLSEGGVRFSTDFLNTNA